MSLQVHIIPQDLPPDETGKLIVKSLRELQKATDTVFLRIEDQIRHEKGKLTFLSIQYVKVAGARTKDCESHARRLVADHIRNLQLRLESLEKKIDQMPTKSKV